MASSGTAVSGSAYSGPVFLLLPCALARRPLCRSGGERSASTGVPPVRLLCCKRQSFDPMAATALPA
eukprot:1196870-Amphidinium_carterae.1